MVRFSSTLKLYQRRESRLRCVLSSRRDRWSTIPGTRETAWHDEFVTGLGHATCLGLLAPSFSTYSRGSLRSLFSHLGYPPRAARAINFSNTATVFTAGSRGKHAKLKLSRETARLERVRLEAHREPCEGTRFFVITFFLLYNFLLATSIRVLNKWLCTVWLWLTCEYYPIFKGIIIHGSDRNPIHHLFATTLSRSDNRISFGIVFRLVANVN